MALENIRYYEHGEWRPITIEEADRLYDDSVSVDSHAFMCYGCYHYVTFKKNYYRTDGVFVRSQFAHSRGDEEKQCEYRTSLSADGRQAYLCSTLSMPMRLRFDGLHIRIEIGLLPLTIEEIIRAENSHAEIRIKGNQTVIKRIDASNFSPHATTWITVPGEPTSNYKLDVNPPGFMSRSWKAPLTPFTDKGAFFDKETGRRLPVYADVTVGHAYYLLTTKTYFDSSFSYYDIVGRRVDTNWRSGWKLYEIRANEITSRASQFFLNHHLLLTGYPTSLVPVWPPMREMSHLIDTNHSAIWFVQQGDAQVETYPNGRNSINFIINTLRQIRLLRIKNEKSTTQMVWAAKNTVLRYMYLRPLERDCILPEPEIVIVDDKGTSLPDVLDRPPVNGNILVSPSFDGKVQIEDADGLLYEIELRAEEEVRIQDLKSGMKLRFYQGLDCIRTIEIIKKNQVRKISCNEIVRWAGKPIRLEAKYAWILAYMEPDSLLYKQMLEAFRSGMIPADGLKWINKYAEELIHGK